MRRPLRHRRRGQGFTIMVFLAAIVAAILAFLVTMLGPEALEAYRRHKTEVALTEAREALMGYAMRYRDIELAQDLSTRAMYGYLPLPDLGSTRNVNVGCTTEGCDAGNFGGNAENLTVIGRLPWQTLGTEPLRDGYGECLWYMVSGSHKRTQPAAPMNWDTLGQLDVVVANGSTALSSIVATPSHEQPIAVIFSVGPPLPNQSRNPVGADKVDECGGNYNAANYLDPGTVGALDDVTNYFGGTTNNSAGDTSAAAKRIATQGKIHTTDDGHLWAGGCPTGSSCTVASNDLGLNLPSGVLFDAIRKNSNFRLDVNSLMDRIVGCLRDDLSTSGVAGFGKINGADENTCYGEAIVPRGYYPNYRDMIFVSTANGNVNGENCAGALLFANQRKQGQVRASVANKADLNQYLEGINTLGAAPFSGQEELDRVSVLQTTSQDIVRCVPTTPSFVTTTSATLDGAGIPQLARYTPFTHTLTLGTAINSPLPAGLANALSGCAWTPESRPLRSGIRTYFTFRINDAGFSGTAAEGFTFNISDGDVNAISACGAAAQHLGYSGNNTESPFIAQPKIGLEIDLRREGGFNPDAPNHLLLGRNDPPSDEDHYRGGHVALVYWGGELPISTTLVPSPSCTAPSYEFGGICILPPEEDDNVHGWSSGARTGFAVPNGNPSVPETPLSVPPSLPAGAYKLDPDRTSIPVNQDYHVRVELTRFAATDFHLPQVRAATTSSIDLANPFTLIDANGNHQFAIDGLFLFDGDRVLVKDQFDARQNGVYVWHSGSPPTIERATDADTTGELAGLVVEVVQGSRNAHSIWRLSNTNPAVDADSLIWTNIRVRVSAPASTNLSNPGPTLDGIRMTSGDRVFVLSHGVYIWHGAATAMTTANDVAVGSVIQIQQGSEAPGWWRFDGSTWRSQYVRTSTDSVLDLSNPGSVIGGVTLTNGDRVLVRHQANASDNGIYVWYGASTTMARSLDADSASELSGALTQVREGTHAGRSFRQTSMTASDALGVRAVSWEAIDRSNTYKLEVWILPDSPIYNNMILAMQDTTRPMNVLYPAFTPHIRDSAVIPYPYRNARLGFSIGQRTTATDQTFSISNIFSSWPQ